MQMEVIQKMVREKINGQWYYFDNAGWMVANQWIGDYYVTSSGAMASNTWIGNYYVDGSGKWVPGKTKHRLTGFRVETAGGIAMQMEVIQKMVGKKSMVSGIILITLGGWLLTSGLVTIM